MAQAVVVGVPKMAAMYSTMITNPTAADAPQLTLLRHNDLEYLAKHLLLLPYLFSPQLETLVGGEVWFGDEALRLRAAARACFNDAVRVLGTALYGHSCLCASGPVPKDGIRHQLGTPWSR